ncbi:hypothetical protein BCR32DRAFT_268518 [Anaeromyces robustus]|uniref:Uncharacterized protein n=1 Tax=Anaeromyces robustus TaxID=1754192 RepID=A0A1Y1X6W6_9FUNG|nr:hypothetical protein BCR32DRAFT_268518 [Anaeromyces robustus]|eukprot:ORX81054.1 hypothetical protein BCR32DRAFT_268518 [Anaeromyces robustus]
MAEFKQLLKIPEIVQVLNKINIDIIDEDITKPTAQRVFYIYECMVNYTLGIRYNDLTQPNFEIERTLEYPELLKDSLPLVSFYELISKILKNVGIDSFSFADLINPEPNQLRRYLSAFVQFTYFEQKHTKAIYEFKNKTDEYDNIINDKQERIEELKKKIEKVRLEREKDEIEAQKIKEFNNELINQNRELKSNQDITANNISKLKSQKESLEEKITNTKLMINNNKDDCNRLRTLLVHNPEEFKNVIKNLNNTLNEKRHQSTITDKRIQELQTNMHKMQALKEIINECIKSIQECQENFNEFKSYQKKASDEGEKVEKVDSDVRNLTMENDQLDQRYRNIEEMEQRVIKKKNENTKNLEIKMNQLREKYFKVRDGYVLKMIDSDKHRKSVQEIENQTITLKEQIKSDMAAMNSAYNKLKSQVDCYLSEIQVSLKENI